MKLSAKHTRSNPSHRSGYTLTEMAIVLGAVGIVLGAVWGVSSLVWKNYEQRNVMEQITTIAQNVRDYYDTSIGAMPTGGLTAEIAYNAGLIPSEMRISANNYKHALGGAFALVGAAGSLSFNMTLSDLSKADCINLLMQLPGRMSELGINAEGKDSSNNVSPDNMNVTTATGYCNGTSNNVYIEFKLKN